MGILLEPAHNFLHALLSIYFWIVIASVAMSWLLAFGVVNTHNQLVSTVSEFLYRATEPVLFRIRRRMPDLGGIDFSPVILLLGIVFVQQVLAGLVRYLLGH